MFKKVFGSRKPGPPDRSALEKLLSGPDGRVAKRWYDACAASYLESIDQSGLVETVATAEDRAGPGETLIKGCVIQFSAGGPDRLGFDRQPLTDSQLGAASKVYDTIIGMKADDLFAAGTAAALAYALFAWYAKEYATSVAICTHIIEHLNPTFSGEAYRVRAFAFIMLGDLEKARADLRSALSVMPKIEGAAEPLAALDAALAPA